MNHSSDELPMLGEFTLHTVSLSSKKVEIKYTIESKGTFCIHTDFSPEGEYGVEKIRGVGEVLYSITN